MTAAEKTVIDKLVIEEEGGLLGFVRKRVDREEDVRDIAQDVYSESSSRFDISSRSISIFLI